MINIEIIGTGNHNKGSEMMLLTLLQELKTKSRRFIFQPSSHIDGYEFYGPLNLYPKAHLSFKEIDFSFLFKLIPKRLIKRYGLYFDSDINVVLDASGFSYSDQWGFKPAKKLMSKLKKWEKTNVKVFLLPQAYGPFKDFKLRKIMPKIFDKVSKVYVRDDISLRYLFDLGYCNPEKFEKYPDFTCLLKEKVPSYFNENSYQICIVPNHRMIDKTEFSKEYISLLIYLIERLKEKNLLPFFLIHGGEEDLEVAHKINDFLSHKIEIIQEDNPIFLKGIISNSKALIGSRYHSLISGLNLGIPSFGIGWSHKYNALFTEYNFKEGLLSLPISLKNKSNTINKIVNPEERIKIKKLLSKTNKIKMKSSKELIRNLDVTLKEIEKNPN